MHTQVSPSGSHFILRKHLLLKKLRENVYLPFNYTCFLSVCLCFSAAENTPSHMRASTGSRALVVSISQVHSSHVPSAPRSLSSHSFAPFLCARMCLPLHIPTICPGCSLDSLRPESFILLLLPVVPWPVFASPFLATIAFLLGREVTPSISSSNCIERISRFPSGDGILETVKRFYNLVL